MKKIFTLAVMLTMALAANAQMVKLYKNNVLVAEYNSSEVNKVKIRKEHEYVDLGLSVKWATCNVGAEKPEDYGDYFAWGETTGFKSGKTNFSWSTYKWCRGTNKTMTKYCHQTRYGDVDHETVIKPEDDAATVNWSSEWRMPSNAELEELKNTDNCTWTWYDVGNTEFNGVAGYKVTSKKTGYTGNSIFLPAAGYRWNDGLNEAGSVGYYWSSLLNTDYCGSAWYLVCNWKSQKMSNYDRSSGRSVRPVCP